MGDEITPLEALEKLGFSDNDIPTILQELQDISEDPEATYELERVEEHYHNYIQAKYLNKDDYSEY